jgi:UrcA family protein
MQTKSLFIALSAVAAFGFAAQSQAAPAQNDDTVSVKVSYAGLDLSSQAGAQIMLRRITNAAHSICGPEAQSGPERLNPQYGVCVGAIVQKSVASLGAPMVTAMNRDKTSEKTLLLARGR